MVCQSFPPMSASRSVTRRSSTQSRPWFHAALLYLGTLQMSLLVSSSSKGLGKHSLPQEHHCQAGSSVIHLLSSPLDRHNSTRHSSALTLMSDGESCQMNGRSWLMASTRGRTSGCNSVLELLQLGGYLARRHRIDLAGIPWLLSVGRTLALGRIYARMHDGGAGGRCPAVPLDNCYKIHLEMSFFFRSLLPSADNSFEMQPALPGLAARYKGKHALLQAVASKARSSQAAPHRGQSS